MSELTSYQLIAFIKAVQSHPHQEYINGYAHGINYHYHGPSHYALPHPVSDMLDRKLMGNAFANGFSDGFNGFPPPGCSRRLGLKNRQKYDHRTTIQTVCEHRIKEQWLDYCESNGFSLTEFVTQACRYALEHPEVMAWEPKEIGAGYTS